MLVNQKVDVISIGLSAVAGAVNGLALQHPFGGSLINLIGVALLIKSVLGVGVIRATLSVVAYLATLGTVGASWVPTALMTLHATPVEALVGMVITTAWAAGPHVAAIALPLAFIRTARFDLRIAGTFAIVFAADVFLLRMPGAVPWTPWGYLWVENVGVIQLASWGGVPLVSAVVAIGGLSVGEVVQAYRSATFPPLACAILIGVGVLSVLGLPISRLGSRSQEPSGVPMRFLAIQPDLPRDERFRPAMQGVNTDRLIQYSQHVVESDDRPYETFLVWPENSVTATLPDLAQLDVVRNSVRKIGVGVVLGVSIGDPTDFITPKENRIYEINRDGSMNIAARKAVAVPVLEAVSTSRLAEFATHAIGLAGFGQRVRVEPTATASNGPTRALGLLCFEVLFPKIAEQRRPSSSTLILNLADNSWIERPAVGQHLAAMLRFRAVEQRLPALRVAHGGLTVGIDEFGRIESELPEHRYGSLSMDIRPSKRPSYFSQCAPAALLVVAIAFANGILARAATARSVRMSNSPYTDREYDQTGS